MTGISTEIIVHHVETLNDVVSTSTHFITLDLKMEIPLVQHPSKTSCSYIITQKKLILIVNPGYLFSNDNEFKMFPLNLQDREYCSVAKYQS